MTQGLGSFTDVDFGEAAFADQREPTRAPAVDCWFHVARLAALCVAGDDARGHAAARAAEPSFAHIEGLLSAHDYYFYDALCIAGLFDAADAAQRTAMRARLASHEARLRDWSAINTETFGHSQLVVAAELARVDGDPLRAMGLYERALEAARAHGYTQIEAIANERVARFYRRSGGSSVADAHQRAARKAYARWGAEAKVRQIDRQYPHLARSNANAETAARADGSNVAQIDALAIVRAAQAITGPMLPEQLLRELLTIVLQQAGAQFGALLLCAATIWCRPPRRAATGRRSSSSSNRRGMRIRRRTACRPASQATSGAAPSAC